MEEKELHRPTLRVLEVLQAVAAARDGLTLTELSGQTAFPKSSLFPVAHTMAECGFLAFRPETGRYTLGMRAFEAGQRYLEQVDVLREVQEQMREIVRGCLETCYFGVLRGGDVFYLCKEDSPEAIRMVAGVGKRLPAYGTGIGKALLADFGLAELRALYPQGLRPLTPHTITDLNVLARELSQIRCGGLAAEKEESNPHVQCVAVPIRQDGKIVCALSVAIPVFRADEGRLELAGRLLLEAKEKLEILIDRCRPDFTCWQ